MSDNDKPEGLFKATFINGEFKIELGSKHIPKLLTALKLTELEIENIIIAKHCQPDKTIVTETPKGLIDKIRGR